MDYCATIKMKMLKLHIAMNESYKHNCKRKISVIVDHLQHNIVYTKI